MTATAFPGRVGSCLKKARGGMTKLRKPDELVSGQERNELPGRPSVAWAGNLWLKSQQEEDTSRSNDAA